MKQEARMSTASRETSAPMLTYARGRFEYGDDMTAIKWRGVLKANMELNAVFMLRAAPDVTKSVTE